MDIREYNRKKVQKVLMAIKDVEDIEQKEEDNINNLYKLILKKETNAFLGKIREEYKGIINDLDLFLSYLKNSIEKNTIIDGKNSRIEKYGQFIKNDAVHRIIRLEYIDRNDSDSFLGKATSERISKILLDVYGKLSYSFVPRYTFEKLENIIMIDSKNWDYSFFKDGVKSYLENDKFCDDNVSVLDDNSLIRQAVLEEIRYILQFEDNKKAENLLEQNSLTMNTDFFVEGVKKNISDYFEKDGQYELAKEVRNLIIKK